MVSACGDHLVGRAAIAINPDRAGSGSRSARPYKGSGDALGPGIAFMKAGKVRPLAVTSAAKRSPSLPDVPTPTLASQGGRKSSSMRATSALAEPGAFSSPTSLAALLTELASSSWTPYRYVRRSPA